MLEHFPRVALAHLPTPLERLDRLSEVLGGPEIWVKRDDCTGLATGGNKTRKLEFSMAAALSEQADTIITTGAVQSNHVRQTAAAACKLGLACEVLLEHRVAGPDTAYEDSGNVFLDRLFGARLHQYAAGTNFAAAMDDVASRVRAAGGTPYIIPGGASNPIGALGYVNCALELHQQARERGLHIDYLVTATGSAGTQAGLAVGLKGIDSDIDLLGIGVSIPRLPQEEKVFALASDTAALLGRPGLVSRKDIVANCDYVGEAYGVPTEAMNDALLLLARCEGLLFDPVYSGKALAGMIDLVRQGHFERDATVVFLHTGGTPALYAYVNQLRT